MSGPKDRFAIERRARGMRSHITGAQIRMLERLATANRRQRIKVEGLHGSEVQTLRALASKGLAHCSDAGVARLTQAGRVVVGAYHHGLCDAEASAPPIVDADAYALHRARELLAQARATAERRTAERDAWKAQAARAMEREAAAGDLADALRGGGQ